MIFFVISLKLVEFLFLNILCLLHTIFLIYYFLSKEVMFIYSAISITNPYKIEHRKFLS